MGYGIIVKAKKFVSQLYGKAYGDPTLEFGPSSTLGGNYLEPKLKQDEPIEIKPTDIIVKVVTITLRRYGLDKEVEINPNGRNSVEVDPSPTYAETVAYLLRQEVNKNLFEVITPENNPVTDPVTFRVDSDTWEKLDASHVTT